MAGTVETSTLRSGIGCVGGEWIWKGKGLFKKQSHRQGKKINSEIAQNSPP